MLRYPTIGPGAVRPSQPLPPIAPASGFIPRTCIIPSPSVSSRHTFGSSHRPATHTRPMAQAGALPPEVVEGLAQGGGLELQDMGCLAFATGGAIAWVKIFDYLASNGLIDKKLSRKLVHMTSGPLYVLTWPLFSANPTARFIAAIVPSLNAIRLFSVGSGAITDSGLVKSVSRSGDTSELLKGPFYYCLVLISTTILFWRENPAGLVAISLMCGGDGLADIVGRRWGDVKLPYNPSKSWAGSVAMMGAGMTMSLGSILLFSNVLGFFPTYPLDTLVSSTAVICLLVTVVESLPVNQVLDDNLSVPATAVLLSLLLLPAGSA